ncbi:hypothetical protein M1M07_26535 [Rhodococcus sp. HM1]|nr:hypothetical protein [Rhodococcus sp. HM1]MCK8674652.1 hypothetical protein [Rhodococcus sp. HM1]
MIVTFGLVVLLAAVIVELTGVLSNNGAGHTSIDSRRTDQGTALSSSAH